MNKNFYQGKNILVTGHTGFKGGWLALWLSYMGANVTGYAIEPLYQPAFYETIGLLSEIQSIHGDMRDRNSIQSAISEHKPEIIFHLAAQPFVRYSYENPYQTFESNVMGAVNLLEAVRQSHEVRVVVIITSDKCYDNKEWVWGYRENDPLGGSDPYSASKACTEIVTNAYRQSFFPDVQFNKTHQVAIASARAGNVIGGGDWGIDRLVPDCMRSLNAKSIIRIRNPASIRPWQYVLDPLEGYMLLCEKLWEDGAKYNGAWNFGPSGINLWSVEDVVKQICHLWQNGNYVIKKEANQPHEANMLKLDCSKSMAMLNWKLRYGAKQSIYQTVKWYKQYYKGVTQKELMNFSINQISSYQQIEV